MARFLSRAQIKRDLAPGQRQRVITDQIGGTFDFDPYHCIRIRQGVPAAIHEPEHQACHVCTVREQFGIMGFQNQRRREAICRYDLLRDGAAVQKADYPQVRQGASPGEMSVTH